MSLHASADDGDIASRYAAHVLRSLGCDAAEPRLGFAHPAVAAARCGLMGLTGLADTAPWVCPVPLAAAADGALAALAALAPAGVLADLSGADLLTERAAHFGHRRNGRQSAGGSCRLIDTRDGAVALNLAREDDWDLMPALFEQDVASDWDAVSAAARPLTMHDVVERGRLLGLAVAPVAPPKSFRSADELRQLLPLRTRGEAGAGTRPSDAVRARPRVLDLSSLWAGPLCGHLLQRCGADVVKLESRQRPDGARRGPPAFFDLLNAGKRSVALDFSSAEGRAQLRALIDRADIVIEASRPRALRQLGIDADALVRERPALTWISLTGYGRSDPYENWIAYGDDAGVAAGLSWLMRITTGQPVIVGDAIGDPLTGLHAALAAWAGWRAGGAGMISLPLVDVLRHVMGFEAPVDADGWRRRAQRWTQAVAADDVRMPALRTSPESGPALDAHRAGVFADWGIAC